MLLANRLPRLAHWLKRIGNLWIPIFIYLAMATLLVDGMVALCYVAGYITQGTFYEPSFLLPRIVAILCVVTVATIYGLCHARQIGIKHYDIALAKSCVLAPELCVVLVADIHLNRENGCERVVRLVQKINSLAPDVVCIAGDIFDSDFDAVADIDTVAEAFAAIRSRYGVFACLGNHDMKSIRHQQVSGCSVSAKGIADIPSFLQVAQIRLLEDEMLLVEDAFYLAGRKDKSLVDREHSRLSIPQLLAPMVKERPVIVLDHHPDDMAGAVAAGADLILSGHTHRGQIFPFNLFVKKVNENAYGHVQRGRTHSVVTSGASVWGPPLRVGSSNEIVALTLQFAE